MKTRILVTASIVVGARGSRARAAAGRSREPADAPRGPLCVRALRRGARRAERLLPTAMAVASDRKSIEQYRSLCLLALGRGSEAESAIAAVVTADPLFLPGEADASPRVRARVQRRAPAAACRRSRRALRRRQGGLRSQGVLRRRRNQFRELLTLLDDPQMGGPAQRSAHARHRVPRSRGAQPPAPPPEPKRATARLAPPAPVEPRGCRSHLTSGRAMNLASRRRPRCARRCRGCPSTIAAQARERGLLEVVIDEQGRS